MMFKYPTKPEFIDHIFWKIMLSNLFTFIEIGEQEVEMRTYIQYYFEKCMDAVLVKELLKSSEKPVIIVFN